MKISIIVLLVITSCTSCAQKAGKNVELNVKRSFQLVDSANELLMRYGDDSITQMKRLQLLNSAISLNENNAVAFSNKITTLLGLHRFKEAIATIEQIDPTEKSSNLLMLRGVIYEEQYQDTTQAQGYYDKALDVLDSMCQANPNNKGYEITRAFTILFAKGKLQGIKAYNALWDKYPGDSSIIKIKDRFYDFDRRQYLKSLW